MSRKVNLRGVIVSLFGLVIIGCTQGTQTQNLMGSGNRQVLVANENNIPQTYQALSDYVAGLRNLVNNQKTKLTPDEIRNKLNSLPQTLGIGSKDAFQQPLELVDTTPVDTATAEKYLSSSLGARGAMRALSIQTTSSTMVDGASATAGDLNPIPGAVTQYLVDIIAYLLNLPEELLEVPLPPDNPSPNPGQPADLLVGEPIPPPQGFGIGQRPPEVAPPAPNNPPAAGGFVGPPPRNQFCRQFGIGGKCCNPDFGGQGALADRCTVYFRIPINLPPRFVGFYFGNCSWVRNTGLLNCPDSRYFTGWSCPPRDPNAC